jgi:uncharacterized protein (DUF433 family)
MAEWAYKVKTRKWTYEDTKKLVDAFGFVARSAYGRREDGSAGNRIASVRFVYPDDILHFYYRDKDSPHPLGSFRVRDPRKIGPCFSPAWSDEGGALARVMPDAAENGALIDFLENQPKVGEGYLPDPKLKVFTGWLVERIPGRNPPDFGKIRFPQRATLTCVDASALERGAADTDLFTRVVHNPQVMGGKPCIRGTRVTVGMILGMLSSGKQPEDILDDFPYLTAIDVRAALAYAAWRMQERELPVEAA